MWSLKNSNTFQVNCISCLGEKTKASEKFKNFKAMVENETNCKIKCIRSDSRGEFTSKEFDDFCK